jgi:DNA-binding response OmpR family regulator
MLSSQQNVPDAASVHENISILLVTPSSDDESAVRQILKTKPISKISRCTGVQEALQQIHSTSPAVVICERDLPDGNWKAVLGACEAMPKSPLVVVVSKHADENLWAEVLNLGGYDVLLKPFDGTEVTRVVASTYRQWSGSPARQPVGSQKSGFAEVRLPTERQLTADRSVGLKPNAPAEPHVLTSFAANR